MTPHPLDHPEITSRLFHVRKTLPHHHTSPNTFDGTLPIADGIALGYRYHHAPDQPIIVFFHGNGEIAADYDLLAPLYRAAGAALCIVDYRGYGWSSGVPLTTQLLPDALRAFERLPAALREHGVTNPQWIVKGRSLGSAPAIYLASQQPENLRGLIIESGYADAPSLFRVLGITLPAGLAHETPLPLFNAQRMQQIALPLLVLHGAADTLIPPDQGQALYDASPAAHKRLVLLPNAGHNDILHDVGLYFGAIKTFLADIAAR